MLPHNPVIAEDPNEAQLVKVDKADAVKPVAMAFVPFVQAFLPICGLAVQNDRFPTRPLSGQKGEYAFRRSRTISRESWKSKVD